MYCGAGTGSGKGAAPAPWSGAPCLAWHLGAMHSVKRSQVIERSQVTNRVFAFEFGLAFSTTPELFLGLD